MINIGPRNNVDKRLALISIAIPFIIFIIQYQLDVIGIIFSFFKNKQIYFHIDGGWIGAVIFMVIVDLALKFMFSKGWSISINLMLFCLTARLSEVYGIGSSQNQHATQLLIAAFMITIVTCIYYAFLYKNFYEQVGDRISRHELNKTKLSEHLDLVRQISLLVPFTIWHFPKRIIVPKECAELSNDFNIDLTEGSKTLIAIILSLCTAAVALLCSVGS